MVEADGDALRRGGDRGGGRAARRAAPRGRPGARLAERQGASSERQAECNQAEQDRCPLEHRAASVQAQPWAPLANASSAIAARSVLGAFVGPARTLSR